MKRHMPLAIIVGQPGPESLSERGGAKIYAGRSKAQDGAPGLEENIKERGPSYENLENHIWHTFHRY